MLKELDLIDTLWNVKALSVTNGNGATRFNRYIVECKGGVVAVSLF